MVALTGQMGVPVIVVNGEAIIGFNRSRLEQLLSNNNSVQRIAFGLSVADASKIAQRAGSTPIFGAFIGKVAPSSPGARAGLIQGDIIMEINLRPIHNADDMEKAILLLHPKDRVVIEFTRGRENLRAEITL